ncbi:pimeloyl-ACP methyl ester carboxylesterase [Kordia periserrulae]|uniref:Pimeloyl-ACP methyl ester carboxylesterase n=1 Tax=Kordia periserrulae TaxID=701523 RepID=A0A2T6C645_9FLAO|nr:alpha/beta fold hydrolase [Kordia periserrulae]PTX63801.1 pimeloyl-ACP methyl ester carboxylesterase [Kordia periserrulae]
MILHSNILGDGKPLLILHGFLGMSDNWKTLGKKFAKQGFQVHLIDQRNHGRSFHSDDFNYDLLAEDVKRYCEHHQLENISLIGHSMGGKTAMVFATRFPAMLDKLIIVDISPKFYPTHHEQILAGLAAIQKETLTSRSDAEDIMEKYVPDFGTRQFLLKNLYWKDDKTLGLRINLDVLIENVEEIGESLSPQAIYHKETLFLKGDASEYILTGDERVIQQHFPNAIIQEVSNAGHWLHAENPKEFFEKSLLFLNS